MTDSTRITRIATVNGRDLPLAECSWLHISPCGCASGIAIAETQWHAITDEDAAMREFTNTETQREAERDRKLGYAVRLIATEEFRQNRDLLSIDCPHTPKWGVEKTPIPDGMQWAVEGPRKKTCHLVRTEAVYTGNWREYAAVPDARRQPLCGTTLSGQPSWYVEDYRLDLTLECARCTKEAKRLAQFPSPLAVGSDANDLARTATPER